MRLECKKTVFPVFLVALNFLYHRVMGEKQKALVGVVESLGTAKFGVPNVPLSGIIARLGKDDSLVLMDIRSDEERTVSTIAGSITRADFEAAPEKFSQKEVVCFCTVGYLSAATACKLSLSLPLGCCFVLSPFGMQVN